MTAGFPFPEVETSLNAASTLLLVSGYICIRRRAVRAHVTCMISALICSCGFLVFYLTFHLTHLGQAPQPFPHVPLHSTYLAILISHTFLAVGILPLIVITLNRALRRKWNPHLKIARWTLPLWLYVSITGVIVYWMLYRLAPTLHVVTASR